MTADLALPAVGRRPRLERLRYVRDAVAEAGEGSPGLDRVFYLLDRDLDEVLVERDQGERLYVRRVGEPLVEVAPRDVPPVSTSVDAVLPYLGRYVPGVLDADLGWDSDCPDVWPAVGLRWYPRGRPRDGRGWCADVVSRPTLALTLLLGALQGAVRLEEDRVAAAAGEEET